MSFITWVLCQTVSKALINQHYIHCCPLVHTVISSQRAIRLVEPGLCMVNPCWLIWLLKPEIFRSDTSFRPSINVVLRGSKFYHCHVSRRTSGNLTSPPEKQLEHPGFTCVSPYPMWVSMEQIKMFCLSEASSIVCVALKKYHWMKPFKLLRRL